MSADPSPLNGPAPSGDDLTPVLRRLAAAELDFARARLTEAPDDPAQRIHACRKAIKRLRAIAGLARHDSPAQWRRVDRTLRRAGRSLSALRDADVVAATVHRLEPAESALTLVELIGPGADGEHLSRRMRQAVKRLDKAERRLERLALFAADKRWSRSDLERGLHGAARRLDRAARRFLDAPTDSNAHRLRKCTQRHLAQLRLLAPAPDVDRRIDALADLADELGAHHDLYLLRETLARLRKRIPTKQRRRLRRSAKKMQREIVARAADALTGGEASRPDGLFGACDLEITILRDESTPELSTPATHGA